MFQYSSRSLCCVPVGFALMWHCNCWKHEHLNIDRNNIIKFIFGIRAMSRDRITHLEEIAICALPYTWAPRHPWSEIVTVIDRRRKKCHSFRIESMADSAPFSYVYGLCPFHSRVFNPLKRSILESLLNPNVLETPAFGNHDAGTHTSVMTYPSLFCHAPITWLFPGRKPDYQWWMQYE